MIDHLMVLFTLGKSFLEEVKFTYDYTYITSVKCLSSSVHLVNNNTPLCISTVTGVTPCQLVCAAANTNPILLAIRESVAQDGTPCTNPDSSTGISVAGICTVRL